MEKERVKVQIDGMSFYVVGEEDAEYIRMLAKELNEMYDITHRSNGRLNQVQAQVLTSLNLLDQYKKAQDRLEDVKHLSENAQEASEKLAQVEELTTRLNQGDKDLASFKKINQDLEDKVKTLEKDKQDLMIQLKKERENLEEKASLLLEIEKKNNELEERNYRSQLQVTDLNKEISILRGEA